MNKQDSKAKMRTCMVRMVVCVLRQLFEVRAGQHIWCLLNKAVVCWIVGSVHVCLSISLLKVLVENLKLYSQFNNVYSYFTVFLLYIYKHKCVNINKSTQQIKNTEHQRDQLSPFSLTEYNCKPSKGYPVVPRWCKTDLRVVNN